MGLRIQTGVTITKFPITITITSKMSGFFERKITLNDRQNDWDCLSFHCQSLQSRHHPFKATEAAKTAVFPMSMAQQQAIWRFLIIDHAFSLYRTVGVGCQHNVRLLEDFIKWVNDCDCERKDQRYFERKLANQITFSNLICDRDLAQK